MDKIKEALKHIWGWFTDEQNEGDFLKVCGAALMIVAIVKFATGQGFDAPAFGTGAASFATSKALDAVLVKIKGK